MHRILLALGLMLLTTTGCPDDGDKSDPDLAVATIHDLKTCTVDMYLRPVCGVDGKTYSNPEYADCAQVAVAYEGPCHD